MRYGEMLIGGLLTLIALLIGYAFGTNSEVKTSWRWWEVVSAIAALGAALGAVYFSVQTAKKSRESEVAQGKLAAWMLWTPLIELLVLAETTAEAWRNDLSVLSSLERQVEDKRKLMAVRQSISHPALIPIALVHQECARELAKALSQIDLVITLLAYDGSPIGDPERLTVDLEEAAKKLRDVRGLLKNPDGWT